MAKIGFIGLGHMGLPMAINLLKAGHDVIGLDLQKEATQALAKAHGHIAKDVFELADSRDFIISMLQTGEQVESIFLGKQGLYQNMGKAIHIDSSTISVEAAKRLHSAAEEQGLASLDAPVSGGVTAAIAGSLTFMIGGQEETFNKAIPILKSMGKQLFHAGAGGSGQAAKICNNMLLGISMIAVSEAFALGERFGLNPQKLFETINYSSGQCWVLSRYIPVPGVLPNVPANNKYQPGFTNAMMLKDLDLSQEAARALDLETPMAEKAEAIYKALNEKGLDQLDFSSVFLNYK